MSISNNVGELIGMSSKAIGSYHHRAICRVCGNDNLKCFLSLGETPLANRFLDAAELVEDELYYPLDVYYCCDCGLVQLLDIVPPERLFSYYAYFTSASLPMQQHFSEFVNDVDSHYPLNETHFVVDIGSGDGTLLSSFQLLGVSALGVDPAENVAATANERGVETIVGLFNAKCAQRICDEYGMANVITGTNVFAHVDDLDGFMSGISLLLSDDGYFVIEVPYLLDLLANVEFDTVYHEHLSYFGLRPLIYLFSKYGMSIADIEKLTVHGGSIRVYAQKGVHQSDKVEAMLMEEKKNNLNSITTYISFGHRVAQIKDMLVTHLNTLKNEGKTITGYGATAKGNTLLNYCGIDTNTLQYVSDTTPFKQGKYTPGTHIPVVTEGVFHSNPPDCSLLLAWNYADLIKEKERSYIENGGVFIHPLESTK